MMLRRKPQSETLSRSILALLMCVSLVACRVAGTDRVDGDALAKAAQNTGEWLSYGRTQDEQRFVPLDRINKSNISQLGLAWTADLDSDRGQEGTPLVIDGVIYTTTAWSKVRAYDARSGRLLWRFDPQVPPSAAAKACCDVVNRGLAAWNDAVFLGTLDGRLISLDRRTGRLNWSVMTVDPVQSYTITGAPRAVEGMVLIGNGGAEFGVRGYVSAYDAASGKMIWRFYTVPGKPGSNSEPHLAMAEKTWTGEWWRLGGGGTVWDAMAYDRDLGLLYIGVGNGSPWSHAQRSPKGGDNLFLSSIVALNVRTGKYVWHYQTTPAETWDYTATQHMILADLEIGGRTRKVLLQAPKNGFFYVLDRQTGKLLSANNFVPVTWASHIDLQTGRPVENDGARWDRMAVPALVAPGPVGAHNWQPMAFDPGLKLVYIPAKQTVHPFLAEQNWKPASRGFNTGVNQAAGAIPANTAARDAVAKATTGSLIAWDPVQQKERWRVDLPSPWNGGVLATAGGLIFQGNAMGELAAYDSANGRKLWSANAGTGIIAPPISYAIDGTQYVTVLAGWGGIWPLVSGVLAEKGGAVRNVSRLLVFKLDGSASLPKTPIISDALKPPRMIGTAREHQAGARHFGRYCSSCHGDASVGGSIIPDLRRSAYLADPRAWRGIVRDGTLAARAMPAFGQVLSVGEAEEIRRYVILRAIEDAALKADR